MSLVAFERCPAAITPGELHAIADATDDGWITPPIYNSLQAEPDRRWRTVHLRYLDRRGLILDRRRRHDGMHCFRLNQEGLDLRAATRLAA